jgi:hypothetical protein
MVWCGSSESSIIGKSSFFEKEKYSMQDRIIIAADELTPDQCLSLASRVGELEAELAETEMEVAHATQ